MWFKYKNDNRCKRKFCFVCCDKKSGEDKKNPSDEIIDSLNEIAKSELLEVTLSDIETFSPFHNKRFSTPQNDFINILVRYNEDLSKEDPSIIRVSGYYFFKSHFGYFYVSDSAFDSLVDLQQKNKILQKEVERKKTLMKAMYENSLPIRGDGNSIVTRLLLTEKTDLELGLGFPEINYLPIQLVVRNKDRKRIKYSEGSGYIVYVENDAIIQ
jgi:hypothetical protein